MWICARKRGPAHQESTLPHTKASLAALLSFLVSSCFAECRSKSTLMSGGAGGCAQGPVHCRWLCTCLCIACGSPSSTAHACCRTARASLHLLKRSFGLRCDAGPFLRLSFTAYPACTSLASSGFAKLSFAASQQPEHLEPMPNYLDHDSITWLIGLIGTLQSSFFYTLYRAPASLWDLNQILFLLWQIVPAAF